MGFFHWLGGIFDPGGQAAADRAHDNITSTINSPYYQDASQLTGDSGIQQGAAQLANSNIGVNTANVDQDAAQYGQLADVFANIAANGGQLTDATKKQAASDLANTSIGQLNGADRKQAANVLATDSAERNWAAQGANKSKAQILANQLQKQVWNTAVSHANFEAQLAGKGIQNEDRNTAFNLANEMSTAAQNARNNQQTIGMQQAATDYNNSMSAIQAIGGAAGSAMSTGADMASAANGAAATSTANPLYTAPSQNLTLTPSSKYVNPITGSTVDPNLPTDTSSWGDWLAGTSLVA